MTMWYRAPWMKLSRCGAYAIWLGSQYRRLRYSLFWLVLRFSMFAFQGITNVTITPSYWSNHIIKWRLHDREACHRYSWLPDKQMYILTLSNALSANIVIGYPLSWKAKEISILCFRHGYPGYPFGVFFCRRLTTCPCMLKIYSK